jgi:hypothetical protein
LALSADEGNGADGTDHTPMHWTDVEEEELLAELPELGPELEGILGRSPPAAGSHSAAVVQLLQQHVNTS